MKNIVKLLLGVILFSSVNVYATTCSGADLQKVSKAANGIKTNYTINEGKLSEDKEIVDDMAVTKYDVLPSIDFTIYNITNDVFLKITNDINEDETIVTYSSTDNGKYSFSTNDMFIKMTYYIEVFSNLDSCKADSISKITLKKPYYNQNASAEICIENPEVPMCQKYITEDTGADVITIDEKVKEYLKKNNITTTTAKSDASNDGNFFTKNWKLLAIGGGVIVVLVWGYIIISKKRSAL